MSLMQSSRSHLGQLFGLLCVHIGGVHRADRVTDVPCAWPPAFFHALIAVSEVSSGR